ncbi:hypothetical protein JX265_008937 [Neoarthrinium moseri]|uniref:Uncharacterized protein n=1 Tax=Neoarthrinium moseri TaxID=1658444 RepID=A0A9P9WH26_9PEZI|nr:hypothetical protein JX265_008937 [Neoarthrinium moseri]
MFSAVLVALFGVPKLVWVSDSAALQSQKSPAADTSPPSTQTSTRRTWNPQATAEGSIVVFTVVNNHTAAVTTRHTEGCTQSTMNRCAPGVIHLPPGHDVPNEESVVYQDNPDRRIEVGEEVRFGVPAGYHGKMSVIDANYPLTGNTETLLEGSYLHQEGELKLDFDISMVDGFSVPMTCSCAGEVLAGCSWDLLQESRCPEKDRGEGYCRNPLRFDETAAVATDFFRPCQAAAYTFPHDDSANLNGHPACNSKVTCCIGSACAPHIRQCLGDMANKPECRRFYHH